MSKLLDQSRKNAEFEGKMFYPTGYIVAAFEAARDAQHARDALASTGFPDGELTLVSPADMREQATENLEHPSIFAAMGSTIAVRQKQLDLAEEGCTFLLIEADDDDAEAQAIHGLSTAPVRYAVKYRKLVIENLLPKIGSAMPDPEPARASGSSR